MVVLGSLRLTKAAALPDETQPESREYRQSLLFYVRLADLLTVRSSPCWDETFKYEKPTMDSTIAYATLTGSLSGDELLSGTNSTDSIDSSLVLKVTRTQHNWGGAEA